MKDTIQIVGAGIGGLTTAHTLQQKGFNVEVYEAAPEIKHVGAGIVMANNAMQIFKKLDIHQQIEAAGNIISTMKITDEQLHPISMVDLSEFAHKYNVQTVAIHRGDLQQILFDVVGNSNIYLGKRLKKIEQHADCTLTFEDNSTVKSKYLIGADGIKSIVREQLFENSTIRNANQICWRGICDCELPEKYQDVAIEAWGSGKRFGFVHIGKQKVYWYALINLKNKNIEDIQLTDIFRDFHNDVLKIIEATSQSQIIVNEMTDLKPIFKWQKKNVGLIGDAAHATTPNLGQGACQAIEDAYAFVKLLDAGFSIDETFKHYEKIRLNKAHFIVNTSWRIGKMAHLENKFTISLRNAMMRNFPKSANKKQFNKIMDISYLDDLINQLR